MPSRQPRSRIGEIFQFSSGFSDSFFPSRVRSDGGSSLFVRRGGRGCLGESLPRSPKKVPRRACLVAADVRTDLSGRSRKINRKNPKGLPPVYVSLKAIILSALRTDVIKKSSKGLKANWTCRSRPPEQWGGRVGEGKKLHVNTRDAFSRDGSRRRRPSQSLPLPPRTVKIFRRRPRGPPPPRFRRQLYRARHFGFPSASPREQSDL